MLKLSQKILFLTTWEHLISTTHTLTMIFLIYVICWCSNERPCFVYIYSPHSCNFLCVCLQASLAQDFLKSFSSFSIPQEMARNLLRPLSLVITCATKGVVFEEGRFLFLAMFLTSVYTSWHTEAVILHFQSSFEAELLTCPWIIFSIKSLSLSLIINICKNLVIFLLFAFFIAISIMFALFFVGILSPSIDLNKTASRQTSSKEFSKEQTCSLVFVQCGSYLGSNARDACNLDFSLTSVFWSSVFWYLDLMLFLSTVSEIHLGSIFFCASSRSAGGISVSVHICMFYSIKASNYMITTLIAPAMDIHQQVNIFPLSWIAITVP